MQSKEMVKDLEIWKDIEGYKGLYEVSSLGRVKSIKNNIIRKSHLNRDGYLYMSFYKQNKHQTLKIHRIVCNAFNIKDELTKNHVDHIDGNKTNNAYTNLRWCKHGENIKYAIDNGLYNNKGSNHGMSLLKEEDVLEIKKLLSKGEKAKNIYSLYDVSIYAIYDIKQGRTWNHIK